MKTIELDQEQADMEEVARLRSEGKRVTDPGLVHRIRERSEQISRETFEKFGRLNIAVDLIREVRDQA